MIKKINLFLCLILVITVKGGDIETAVNKILPPGMEVQAIADSTIDGIKVVDIGELQPIYVTEDGKYFFYGECIQSTSQTLTILLMKPSKINVQI